MNVCRRYATQAVTSESRSGEGFSAQDRVRGIQEGSRGQSQRRSISHLCLYAPRCHQQHGGTRRHSKSRRSGPTRSRREHGDERGDTLRLRISAARFMAASKIGSSFRTVKPTSSGGASISTCDRETKGDVDLRPWIHSAVWYR